MGPRREVDEARTRGNGSALPDVFTQAQWRRLAVRLDLSSRQRQVARLICRGLTNAGIAYSLGIAEDTVRSHTRVLYEKLEVNDRVGVVVRLVLADRAARHRRGPAF